MRMWLRNCLLIVGAFAIFLAIAGYFSVGRSVKCILPASGSIEPGFSVRTVMSGGVERCYLLFVPVNFALSRSMPVVFSLHGFAGNAHGLRDMTGWESLADQENFLVVYPEGSSFPLRWNNSPAANIEHIDDVQLILDILSQLDQLAAIDEQRVYLTGFSNGGGMAQLAACRLAERIAAVGLVSGLEPRVTNHCRPSRPIPAIIFYGLEDPLVGMEYPEWFQKLINVSLEKEETLPPGTPAEWIKDWAEGWNGCLVEPIEFTQPGVGLGLRFLSCPSQGELVLYGLEGHGHAWPGGPSLPFLGGSSTEVNASQLMWEFFEQHLLVRPT